MSDEFCFIRQETREEDIGFRKSETASSKNQLLPSTNLILYTPPPTTVTKSQMKEVFVTSSEVLKELPDNELMSAVSRLASWLWCINKQGVGIDSSWKCDRVYVEDDDGEFHVSGRWFNCDTEEADYHIPTPVGEYVKLLDDNRLETYFTVAFSKRYCNPYQMLQQGGGLFGTKGVSWVNQPLYFDMDVEDEKLLVNSVGFAPIKTDVQFTDKWEVMSGLLNHPVVGDPRKEPPSTLDDDSIPF